MEDIVSCDICAKEFDSLHVIPKILECGHTFCSPCLTIIIRQNPSCPNCRTEIKGTEGSLPINYNTLRVVDIYKSKGWSESESEIITSIEYMKRNCMERIGILSTKKSSITSSLEVLDHCLAKLEELTVSVSRRVDNLNVKIIFKEVEENLKKTDDVVRCEDIKNSVSILLSNFQDSKEYLSEIYARVQNEEKVFAVRKIEDTIKYGKVSKHGNRLFFHSLSLSEVPTDSSLIWFDELKQCANFKNFHTFIEICCSKKNLTYVFIIKMFDKQQSHHFIKLCTGEYGLSYKGASFNKGVDNERFKSILHCKNFIENGSQCSKMIEYNFCTENEGFYKCDVDQMFLGMLNAKGSFTIFLARKYYKARNGTIGKVISPTNLSDGINYDDSAFLKILDCGITLEV